MFVWHAWRHRQELKDALHELFFGAWAHAEFPEFWELLEEGRIIARDGPDELLNDWYSIRSMSWTPRVRELVDHPRLGRYARYALEQDVG